MPGYDSPVPQKQPDQEKELLFQLQDGVPGAFDQLFHRYWRLIMRLCLIHLKDTSEAEDAAIETFADAAAGIKSFRGQAKLSSWLIRLALNRIAKHRRALSRRLKTVPIENLPADEPAGETLEKEHETDREIKNLISDLKRLPKEQREALILRYILEMELPEVAQTLGITPEAAGMRINRGRNRLRQLRSKRRQRRQG
jgi:RNA polymerase sigma-70 factor (ECF subfamily)